MATGGTECASDEVIDVKCSVCAGQNKTRAAEKYCVECQDYYCIPCTDMHKAFPAMRSHTLLDKSDFNKHGALTSLPSYPTERCTKHKAKILDLFCERHDEVVCATCVATKHRSCQSIHSIPDDIDTIYKQSVSNLTRKELNEEKQQFDEIKQRKRRLLIVLKKQKKAAIDSILGYKKELEEELKRLERESVKQVEAEYGRIERDIQNSIKESDGYIDEFKQFDDNIQKSQGNKAQEFVNVKSAQKVIRIASESKQMLKRAGVEQLVLKVDTNIKQVLKESKVLAQIQVTKTTPYTVKQHNSFSAKIQSDNNECKLYGSCLLQDGSLLVTDINNNALKRIDTSKHTVTDHIILDNAPTAICQTGKQEVAVSLHNKRIAFVSLGNKMKITRKLQLDHNCCGIAYKEDKLFISDEGNAVYLHDINRRMIHKATTDNLGKQIFKNTKHLTLSTNKDFIYVCDFENGLITLDMQGNYVSTFVDDDMMSPVGVCTDGRGNIFVSSHNSSSIIQIREDSMTKTAVIKTDPKPLSVCFDPKQNNLFVTHFKQNSVKVYKLE